MTTTVRAKSDAIEALSAFGKARSTIKGTPLSAEELRKTDAFWRASTYAILGMLYLLDNPLLREPMELAIENQIDRFSLAIDVIDRVPRLQRVGVHAKEKFRNTQIECLNYAHEWGIDEPKVAGWTWPF